MHKPTDLERHAHKNYKRWSHLLESLATLVGTPSSSSTLDRIVHRLHFHVVPLGILEAPHNVTWNLTLDKFSVILLLQYNEKNT